jgi:hypothetical protein
MAGPLVIGMGVRQGMRSQLAAADLTENPPASEACCGVDQHVSHDVDVERERREAHEQFEIVGQAE